METRYIYVVTRGPDASYDKRVQITSDTDVSASLVRVINESGPGITRVLVVESDPDELVYVENEGDLPFEVKVNLFGLPPCPRCGGPLTDFTRSYGCDICRVDWPLWELEFKYSCQTWKT